MLIVFECWEANTRLPRRCVCQQKKLWAIPFRFRRPWTVHRTHDCRMQRDIHTWSVAMSNWDNTRLMHSCLFWRQKNHISASSKLMKLPDTLNSNDYAELMCFFDGYNVFDCWSIFCFVTSYPSGIQLWRLNFAVTTRKTQKFRLHRSAPQMAHDHIISLVVH